MGRVSVAIAARPVPCRRQASRRGTRVAVHRRRTLSSWVARGSTRPRRFVVRPAATRPRNPSGASSCAAMR
eukprot:6183803-Pleurochrysis_carterae.AAC.1